MSNAVLSSVIKIHTYLGVVWFESTILLCGLSGCLVHPRSSVHCKKKKNVAKVPLFKYHSCFVESFQPFCVLPADTAIIALLFIWFAASCLHHADEFRSNFWEYIIVNVLFTVNYKMSHYYLIQSKWGNVALYRRGSCSVCFGLTSVFCQNTPAGYFYSSYLRHTLADC